MFVQIRSRNWLSRFATLQQPLLKCFLFSVGGTLNNMQYLATPFFMRFVMQFPKVFYATWMGSRPPLYKVMLFPACHCLSTSNFFSPWWSPHHFIEPPAAPCQPLLKDLQFDCAVMGSPTTISKIHILRLAGLKFEPCTTSVPKPLHLIPMFSWYAHPHMSTDQCPIFFHQNFLQPKNSKY